MIKGVLEELGGITLFYFYLIRTFFRTSGNTGRIIEQIAQVSFRSISIVCIAGAFVGAILVLQFNQMLLQYDAQSILGGLNTSACIREVGPLIISFLLAGKIGAFTTAELGTMRVTEQIDAVECLGTDSLQYLVLPRFIAIIFSSLILLILGLVVSLVGAMAVADLLCGVNPLQFISSIPRFAGLWMFAGGMFRSFVFGTLVAGVSCYKGYTASGGARGVGRAVTLAAVYTNLYIVIANTLAGYFLDGVHEVSSSLLRAIGMGI